MARLSRILVATLLALAWLQSSPATAGGNDCEFVRGDVVTLQDPPPADPVIDLNDGVDIVAFLFLSRSVPDCVDAADVNDNGLVELADYTYLVNYLFDNGPAPAAPFTAAGVDPTPGVTVPNAPDDRFVYKLGTAIGVPGNTGIAIPVTMSNATEITGFQMLFTYSPGQIRIDEIITEENTLLSQESAEYITAEFHNDEGVAYIAALKDFATPFSFQVGESPFLPAGNDQPIATLKCAVVVTATQGFAAIEFTDGVKIPNDITPAEDPARLPEVHNLVFIGTEAIRPTLEGGFGIDVRQGFIRGDANADRRVDIADPIFVLNYLFKGLATPPCKDAADSNNDTRIDIADSIWLLNYMFSGGPQPSEPFPQPGVDPSDDGGGSLGCDSDTP